MDPVRKNAYAFAWCIAGTALTLAFAFIIRGNTIEIGAALFAGAFAGVFPLSILLMFGLMGRRLIPALTVCLAFQAMGAIVGVMLLPRYASEFEILPYAWGGFVLGLIAVRIWCPREMVYRYARCPGCNYNLALLPKSDVCPECGRDNTDLVEIFADIDVDKKTRPMPGVLDLDDLA